MELIVAVLKIGAAVVVGVPLVVYFLQDGLLFGLDLSIRLGPYVQ